MIDFLRNSKAHIFVDDLNSEIVIRDDDHHHLSRVMRLKQDDRISVASNSKVCEYSISKIDKNEIIAAQSSKIYEIEEPDISVIVGIFKIDRLEWGISKAVEAGAKKIIVAQSHRSPTRFDEKKKQRFLERAEAIVRSASMQSRHSSLAKVSLVDDLIMACETVEGPLVVCEPNGDSIPPSAPVTIVIGPEGGFSDEEIHKLDSLGSKWSFSPFILRAETAMAIAPAIIANQ